MTQKEIQQKRRARLKAIGLCVDCGKHEAGEGHVVCLICRSKRTLRIRGYLTPREKRMLPVYSVETLVSKAERIARLKRWAA